MEKEAFRKIISALLVVGMVVGLVPIMSLSVSAETYTGTCGDNVTWELDTDTGVLEISGTGAMTNWTSYSSVPWYSYRQDIHNVNISN